MIKSIHIENFKCFERFDLELNDELNIIVGKNEEGKSTILDAINLALTRRLSGKLFDYELSPYLFCKEAEKKYLESLQGEEKLHPPEILIELYFHQNATSGEFGTLMGTHNSRRENVPGVFIKASLSEDFYEEYEKLMESPDKITSVPSEYYKVEWCSFAGNAITRRTLNAQVSYIDATTIYLHNGTDYYIQDILRNDLDAKERVGLSYAYRSLKEDFSAEESISGINARLNGKAKDITDKKLTLSIDVSQKASWETHLVPHLDDLPIQSAGKGEQSALKIMLALERRGGESSVILIEEPENHLSYSLMNQLISRISDKCSEKQLIIATHSTFVINKLGLNSLVLLANKENAKLDHLSEETQGYFKKLAGYDTLRIVLADKSILVEGPSDELILQKAYHDIYDKLPSEDGIDVISMSGLSAKRFLDIAKLLKKEVKVVTDNDHDYQKNIVERFEDYTSDQIKIFGPIDNDLYTLEVAIVSINTLDLLNKVFNKQFQDSEEVREYMLKNKTEAALKIFESDEKINYPEYIKNAIKE